ncbi:hypothetical protein [Nocardioides sp. AE5]|uniref:hypothetical protein n=1 Tax=Nocardioides sp. AE5 TaxID=2962573 RepID=UPI00288292BF|nr:hypothetical protein [Nocardioides sp. AE5]MDT0203090.1 hypothetical protein [Nocardioides sp. AE5]
MTEPANLRRLPLVWLIAVAVLVTLALLPLQRAEAADGPPELQDCLLVLPEPDTTDALYFVDEEVWPAGDHPLTADDYPGLDITLETENQTIGSWYIAVPLDCTVTIEVFCEGFSITNHLDWETTGFTYQFEGDEVSDQIGLDTDETRTITGPPGGGNVVVTVTEAEMRNSATFELPLASCDDVEDNPEEEAEETEKPTIPTVAPRAGL